MPFPSFRRVFVVSFLTFSSSSSALLQQQRFLKSSSSSSSSGSSRRSLMPVELASPRRRPCDHSSHELYLTVMGGATAGGAEDVASEGRKAPATPMHQKLLAEAVGTGMSKQHD